MDKYSRLRPLEPTPDSEICKCISNPPFVLQGSLGNNPICCADCNLEVDTNKLGFSVKLIDRVADWCSFHFSFYYLWLDSKELESWAKEQLVNPDSPVNKRALDIRREISMQHECFYWWFRDNSETDAVPPTNCPMCGNKLSNRKNKFRVDTLVCRSCMVLLAY